MVKSHSRKEDLQPRLRRLHFFLFHILTKGGTRRWCGAGGGFGAKGVEKRVCFPGQPAFRGWAGGRERGVPRGRCSGGGGGALVLVPHPPFWAVGKKSSLIGSLAVSFTLNVRVKQKSQASLCWQGRSASCLWQTLGLGPHWAWGLTLPEQGLPSLPPLPSGPQTNRPNPGTRVLRGWDRSHFAGPVRVHVPSNPSRPHAAKPASACRG